MNNSEKLSNDFLKRITTLGQILDIVWMVIMSVMIILSQIGYMMMEFGTIKTTNNTDLLLKNIIVMAVSSLTFFLVGYGFAKDAKGGLLGQNHFAGNNYDYDDYASWLYYFSLCVTMAQIATGSIAERLSLDTYFFFTFLTSALIFPMALAWCWEDGWLANMGFVDFAGAGIVHLTGGISGFIGAYLTGARIGMFQRDSRFLYMLDDANFLHSESEDEDVIDSEID